MKIRCDMSRGHLTCKYLVEGPEEKGEDIEALRSKVLKRRSVIEVLPGPEPGFHLGSEHGNIFILMY